MDGVAGIDVVFFEEFIGEVRAGFESELLRKAESVVAVEEDVLDLWILSVGDAAAYQQRLYRRHLDERPR